MWGRPDRPHTRIKEGHTCSPSAARERARVGEGQRTGGAPLTRTRSITPGIPRPPQPDSDQTRWAKSGMIALLPRSVTIAQERREPSAELTVGTPASDCPVAVTDSRAKIRAVTTSAPPLIRPRSIARTLRDILAGFGVVAAGVLAVAVLVLGIRHYGFGWDSRAYWLAWRHHGLYGNHAEELGAYLYSPVFAELVWPLTTLSWPVFATLWAVATAGIFVWLLWPLELPWRLFCLLLCCQRSSTAICGRCSRSCFSSVSLTHGCGLCRC